MAEQDLKRVSREEQINTNKNQIMAITRLLIRRNLLSQKEILIEVSNVRWEENEKAKETGIADA